MKKGLLITLVGLGAAAGALTGLDAAKRIVSEPVETNEASQGGTRYQQLGPMVAQDVPEPYTGFGVGAPMSSSSMSSVPTSSEPMVDRGVEIRAKRPDIQVTSDSKVMSESTSIESAPVPEDWERNKFSAGLGYATLSYNQTGKPAWSGTNVTVKGAWRRRIIPRKWDLDSNLFFSAAPLSSNQSGTSVIFIGANIRAGYYFHILPDPWFTRLAGGLYYTTMFVSSKNFGYQNLLYPEIYPNIGYRLSRGRAISAYFKYVPTDLSIVPNGEHEVAGGISYSMPAKQGSQNNLSFSLDMSDLIFDPTDTVRIHTTAFVLGAGYSF